MLKTVEGIYQNGQIELTELPQDMSDRSISEIKVDVHQMVDYAKGIKRAIAL